MLFGNKLALTLLVVAGLGQFAAAGEAGGLWHQRPLVGSPLLGYYADLSLPGGTLDLSAPLSASGKGFSFYDESTPSPHDAPGSSPCGRGWRGSKSAVFGFFDTATGPFTQSGIGANLLGFTWDSQTSFPNVGKNIRVLPLITLADGTRQESDFSDRTPVNIYNEVAPLDPNILNAAGGTYDWRMDWDPTPDPTGDPNAGGFLTVTISNIVAGDFMVQGGAVPGPVVVTAALHKDDAAVATFDAFGLMSTWAGGVQTKRGACDGLLEHYVDDLEYGRLAAPPGFGGEAGVATETQSFDSEQSAVDAGWTAFNNAAAAHPEGIPESCPDVEEVTWSPCNHTDFGFSDTNNASPDAGLPGDFDGNGVVDAEDIDLLCDELGGSNPDFNLNGDGMVNSEDADKLILEILGTEYGDADLMGGATLGDLGTLASNFTSTRTDFGWADGDFNWDGEVTLADLGILASNFGANGPIPQAEFEAAVEAAFGVPLADLIPEPGALGILAVGAVMMWRRRH